MPAVNSLQILHTGLQLENHHFTPEKVSCPKKFSNKSSNYLGKKGFTSLHSESESIERYGRGLTERFWRGNEKVLSDLCRLAFSDLPSFIPSEEAAEVGTIRVEKL
jgi:hypothetical protein